MTSAWAGILTGRCDKAFCARADISTFPATPGQARSFVGEVLPVLVRRVLPQAAYRSGQRLHLAEALNSPSHVTSSWHREALDSACRRFNSGLLPGFALLRLHEIVGRPKAKELSMLGEPTTDMRLAIGHCLRHSGT